MALASSSDNIRYNGTGRVLVGTASTGTSFDDLGDLENLTFSMSVSKETLKTNRNATRAAILEVTSDREATLSFGLREMTNNNLKMALLSDSISTLNQSASYVYQDVPTYVDDLYIDLGHLNVYSTKLTGAISSSLTLGETMTGGTSGATGKLAYEGTGYVELVNVSGTFSSGETVTGGTSSETVTVTGVETLDDVVVTNAAGDTRMAAGTDYTLDPDYGYLRKLSSGSMGVTDVVSYDYEAVDKKYMWALESSSVEKKLIFMSDKDDQGPRHRWTFHKVNISLDGDFPLIGDGAAVLGVTATVLADTTQSSGQEYFKTEIIG